MGERETEELEVVDDRPDDLIGTQIGGYEIRKRIGQGGMGAVYLGVHPTLGRRVAVKVILGGLDEAAVARFADEARAIGRIESPHIVDVRDFAELPDGRRYLMMEFLDGESVQAIRRRERKLGAATAVAIAQGALAGLEAAHARSIVHRDVKPANLFVARGSDGVVRTKILDFGIAKLGTRGRKTTSGVVVGTPEYMAPEQASGAAIDGRADLYALGIVLFELLSGDVPFQSENWLAVLLAHKTEPPPPLPDDVPPAIARVVARALAKDPADRFASAAEMRAALGAAAAEAGIEPALPEIQVAPPESSERPTTPARRRPADVSPSPAPPVTKTHRSSRAAVIDVGALGLVGLLALAPRPGEVPLVAASSAPAIARVALVPVRSEAPPPPEPPQPKPQPQPQPKPQPQPQPVKPPPAPIVDTEVETFGKSDTDHAQAVVTYDGGHVRKLAGAGTVRFFPRERYVSVTYQVGDGLEQINIYDQPDDAGVMKATIQYDDFSGKLPSVILGNYNKTSQGGVKLTREDLRWGGGIAGTFDVVLQGGQDLKDHPVHLVGSFAAAFAE